MEACDAYFVHILTYFIIHHNVFNMICMPTKDKKNVNLLELNSKPSIHGHVADKIEFYPTAFLSFHVRCQFYTHTHTQTQLWSNSRGVSRDMWINVTVIDTHGRCQWCVLFSTAPTKYPYSPIQFHGINKTAELFISLGRVRFWLWWLVVVCTIFFSLYHIKCNSLQKKKKR